MPPGENGPPTAGAAADFEHPVAFVAPQAPGRPDGRCIGQLTMVNSTRQTARGGGPLLRVPGHVYGGVRPILTSGWPD